MDPEDRPAANASDIWGLAPPPADRPHTAPLRGPAPAFAPPAPPAPSAPSVPSLPPDALAAHSVPSAAPAAPTLPSATPNQLPPVAAPGGYDPAVFGQAGRPPLIDRRRRRPAWQRAVRAVFILSLLGGLGALAYLVGADLLAELGDDGLPEFTAPAPHFASARFEFDDSTDGLTSHVVGTMNADASQYEVLVSEPGAPDMTIRRTATDSYYRASGGWFTLDDEPEPISSAVLVFSDFVNDDARPYVEVVDTTSTTRRDRDLEVYELTIDLESFEDDQPAAFTAWTTVTGFEAAEGRGPVDSTRLVLSVDTDGLVWLVESWDDRRPDDRSSFELLGFSEEPLVVAIPPTYLDVAADVVVDPAGDRPATEADYHRVLGE